MMQIAGILGLANVWLFVETAEAAEAACHTTQFWSKVNLHVPPGDDLQGGHVGKE